MGAFLGVMALDGSPVELPMAAWQSACAALEFRAPGRVREDRSRWAWLAVSGDDGATERFGGGTLVSDGRPPSTSGDGSYSDADPPPGTVEFWRKTSGSFSALWISREAPFASLARDRFGTRPLYFTLSGERLLVATSCRVLQALGFGLQIDRTSLRENLLYRWSIGAGHLFSGVTQVRPGEVVRVGPGPEVKTEPYWTLTFSPRPPTEHPLDWYAEAVEDALRSDMRVLARSEGTASILLSGGVDSSVLAALAREEFSRVVAITGRIPGFSNPEVPRASRVAELLGIEFRVVDIEPERFPEDMRRMTALLEELPRNPNNLVLMQLLDEARRESRLVLQGDATGALFGLSEWESVEAFRKKRIFAQLVPKAIRHWLGIQLQTVQGSWGWRVARLLCWDEARFMENFDLIQYSREVRRAIGGSPCEEEFWATDMPPLAGSLEDAFQVRRMGTFALSSLTRHDRLSQPLGLASVCPFLGDDVLRVSQQLPREFRRAPESRAVLRLICDRFLPLEISRWTKMGFEVPWRSWLRGPLRELRHRARLSPALTALLPEGFAGAAERASDGEADWTMISLLLVLEELGLLGSRSP